MRRLTMAACAMAIAGCGSAAAQPSIGAGEHTDLKPSCKVSPVTFPSSLHPGLTVADTNGKVLGKIGEVKSATDGSVTQVQYVSETGKSVSVDPHQVSYSGGPVALVWEASTQGRCASQPPQVVFPHPLNAGVILSDPKGQTLGRITKVQAGAGGVVTSVEYVDEKGATHAINPADVSYSGGDVALLFGVS